MGNTSIRPELKTSVPVHPHTHGEHYASPRRRSWSDGSSPHAWGTRHIHVRSIRQCRFIPTRMGNTVSRVSRVSRVMVHPHTHGEHLERTQQRQGRIGSSPHAWGTRGRSSGRGGARRFIPTRMGNTYRSFHSVVTWPVHPHTHGEHSVQAWGFCL